VTSQDDTRTFVLFRLGVEGYALPVEVVTGIVRFESPTPVPRAPQAVMGVLNLRGRVLPVIDLKARFGAASFSPGPSSRIVVAEGKEGPVGIAVDAATEVATFSVEDIRPVPEGLAGGYVSAAFSGMVEREDGIFILFDPDQAIVGSELGSLAGGVAADREEGSNA
jgi:purine-binding chemotaxis protein CheW